MQNKVILYVISGFLRLGPLGLGLIAALILGAGYYLQVLENQREARMAQALAAGIPAIVDLQDAPAAEALSVIGEVNAQAQLAWEYSYDLWYEEDLGTDYIVMFPLLAPNSSSLNDVIGVALFQAEDEDFSTLSPQMVKAWFVEDAAYGPVMNLNGELGGMGKWQGLVEDSFYDEGLQMPADPIVIWPYVQGRDVALAPRSPESWTIFGLLSKVAGVIGLFALGKMVFARKPEDDIPDPDTEYAEMAAPAAQVSGVPLWKQRSGLAEADAYVPEDDVAPVVEPKIDHTFIKTPTDDALMAPKQAGFGVRKVLIAIVGGLFLLGLAAVASDMMGKPGMAETAGVETVADAVVTDADPNRHWTDIDVTPVTGWFADKGALAMDGDLNAQIALGSIVVGLIFALFMLRFFFSMRRSLTPKTTARFDSMGIN